MPPKRIELSDCLRTADLGASNGHWSCRLFTMTTRKPRQNGSRRKVLVIWRDASHAYPPGKDAEWRHGTFAVSAVLDV
jgi:hypothetical protein